MTRLPNLLVIGAQKCGTTWLHQQLSKHPDIFMAPGKELHFFVKPDDQRNLEDYTPNFSGANGERYVGESTPGYFWTYDADSPYCTIKPRATNTRIPESVRATLGQDIKLILVLRHPVHRAVSAFLHHYKMGRVVPDESLLMAGMRSGIIDMGFYRRHLERWESCFGPNSIYVIFFDDIVKGGAGVLRATFAHLGVADVEIPDSDRPVHRGFDLMIKKNRLVINKRDTHTRKILRHKELMGGPSPVITMKDINKLQRIYEGDIRYFEERFPAANLSWSTVPKLEDFVDPSEVQEEEPAPAEQAG